jgi:Peptidase M50B-like
MSAALGDRSLDRWFWVAVAISLLVSLTPWAQFLLYPFKLFTTWVHESGHAVMTVLVGGRVTSMTIDPDTSGLTQSVVPVGRIGRGLVASSGYLGAAVVGSLLIASIRVQKWAHVILLSVAALMLLTLVFWVRNLFGAAIVLAWSLTLITLARKGVARALRFFLSLLAIQVALNAVYDIRTLFLINRRQSDAETMARLFLLPSWVWATTWMLLSIAILGATIWMTRKRRRRASPR